MKTKGRFRTKSPEHALLQTGNCSLRVPRATPSCSQAQPLFSCPSPACASLGTPSHPGAGQPWDPPPGGGEGGRERAPSTPAGRPRWACCVWGSGTRSHRDGGSIGAPPGRGEPRLGAWNQRALVERVCRQAALSSRGKNGRRPRGIRR